MVFCVQLKKLDPNIEEKAIVQIGNVEIQCFVRCWPSSVEVGHFYNADIDVDILDDFEMKEQAVQTIGFEQINAFAYSIFGKFSLDSQTVDAGIPIRFDQDYLYDYAYLDGKYVSVRVDRINLSFVI